MTKGPSLQDPFLNTLRKEKSFFAEQQQVVENQKIEQTREHEDKLQRIDLGQVSFDSQAKYQSSDFKRFKDWLGNSAPLGTLDRLKATQQKTDIVKKSNEAVKANEPEKDPLLNYIDKNWKPTTTRRR